MNAENDTLHKYVIQNGRRMFRGISEIVGLSILVPRQNSFNDFLWNPSQQFTQQPWKKSNILTQFKDKLIQYLHTGEW